MFKTQLSNQTINNQESTDVHSNDKAHHDIKSSGFYLGTSGNVTAIKKAVKSLMKSIYKKHKPAQVVETPKTHFDKEKLRHQMREEGFWKKYAGNDD